MELEAGAEITASRRMNDHIKDRYPLLPRHQLVSYLEEYSPIMLLKVDKLLENYKGRNGKLSALLKLKFGASPAEHTGMPSKQVTAIEDNMQKLKDAGFLALPPEEEQERLNKRIKQMKEAPLTTAELIEKHRELYSQAITKAEDPLYKMKPKLGARGRCYTV